MTDGTPPARDPRLIALVGITAISFSAILVRAAGVSPSTSAFFRAAYALPVLAGLAWYLQARDQRSAQARWMAIGAGCLLGADLTVWHHSIEYIGAGLATVVANLQVLFVGLLAWIVHGEMPGRNALLAVPVALTGVVLTSGVGQATPYGADPLLGTGLALAAALAYTGFLLIFRQANRSRGPTAGPLLDATLGTAATTLVLGIATDQAFSLTPTWPAHGWLVLLALGAHTLGWLAIARALPRLPALTTSILLLLQPMLAMVWGVLFFLEAPSLLQWIGVVLVLAGVLWASLDQGADARDPRAEVKR